MFCGEFRLKIALPCQWLSQLEIFGERRSAKNWGLQRAVTE